MLRSLRSSFACFPIRPPTPHPPPQKKASRGDPDREAKAWLDKLTEVDADRRGYIKLAAKGRLSEAELEVELAELDETRETAQSELATI